MPVFMTSWSISFNFVENSPQEEMAALFHLKLIVTLNARRLKLNFRRLHQFFAFIALKLRTSVERDAVRIASVRRNPYHREWFPYIRASFAFRKTCRSKFRVYINHINYGAIIQFHQIHGDWPIKDAVFIRDGYPKSIGAVSFALTHLTDLLDLLEVGEHCRSVRLRSRSFDESS